MRLLHTKSHQLTEFFNDQLPPYAILSHTWEHEEVTYQDIQSLDHAATKHGFAKIRGACEVASTQGYEFIWIDTCCIDKSSSAELSEAINSMYLWYQRSAVCYAYLADVPFRPGEGGYAVLRSRGNATIDHEKSAKPHERNSSSQLRIKSPSVDNSSTPSYHSRLWNFRKSEFRQSKWFTRGWTLQELIAPRRFTFYSREWFELGTKAELGALISSITGIDRSILAGGDPKFVSVARRMFWASQRKTTRKEDTAYCLMGLFSVNMPLMYGEGERAFIRLQEEIIKMYDDHSIFAWTVPMEETQPGRLYGLLADSPRAFKDTGVQVSPFPRTVSVRRGAKLTNNSLETAVLIQPQHFTLGSIDDAKLHGKPVSFYKRYFPAILNCQMAGSENSWACIDLMALDHEGGGVPQEFARIDPWVLTGKPLEGSVMTGRARQALYGGPLQSWTIPFVEQWALSMQSFWQSSMPWDLHTITVAHTPRQPLPHGFRVQLLDEILRATEGFPASQWYNHDNVLQRRYLTRDVTQDVPAAFLDSKTRRVTLEKKITEVVGYTETEEVSRVEGVVKIVLRAGQHELPSNRIGSRPNQYLNACVAMVLGVKLYYARSYREWVRIPWCQLCEIARSDELHTVDYVIDWKEKAKSELAIGSGTRLRAEVSEADGNGLYQVKVTRL